MQKPRKILIGGPARSGKTQIARKLSQELLCAHFPMDALVSAFQKHFPETGIVHEPLKWSVICANFFPFLSSLINEFSVEGASCIYDTYHITPQATAELRQAQGVLVLFLGYPNIEEVVKLKCIRTFRSPHDWTDQITDQEMLALIKKFKIESRQVQMDCERLGIPFFDTGSEFDSELSRAYDWVVSNV